MISRMIVVAVVLGLFGYISTAVCWDCPPKRCVFDIDCGINCWCYKGMYQIEGTCVSR